MFIVAALYTMIDGKAANAIVGNRDTKACPLCFKNSDPRIGPSYYHSRLNVTEWLIKNAAKKDIEGNPPHSHPAVKARAREIADKLEIHFHLNINRPKPGGCGSSNNGNMARRLLSEPTKFAEILGISKDLVQNLRLISSLALSSNKLDPQKISSLCSSLHQQIFAEFPFVRNLPPCIHKYQHLSEFAKHLVIYFN